MPLVSVSPPLTQAGTLRTARHHPAEEALCSSDAPVMTSKVRAAAQRSFNRYRESDVHRLASFARSDDPSSVSREAVPSLCLAPRLVREIRLVSAKIGQASMRCSFHNAENGHARAE